MLSLDEAITHCLEVVKEHEQMIEYNLLCTEQQKNDCIECAKEHRQLAEWLKELEGYRDGCHCDTCKYLDKNIKNRPCGYCGDNESKWEYGGKC